MKKALLVLFLVILLPSVYAQQQEEKCGLTNLASCIPQKLYEYTLAIINAPLQPFLEFTKDLMTEPVSIKSFLPIWAIINYIISMFYGIFMMFAGFNFVISGYSDEKRERAKEWIKNVILMIFFIQSSFLIYGLAIDISSSMTTGVMSLIDQKFFELTIDNASNVGLQLILAIPYVFVLLCTIIWLSVRYLLAAIGVILFPIGLFFYFIPPLNSLGKLINNTLMAMIFLPFFQSLIILGASQLVNIGLFKNFKIVVMIATFILVNTIVAYMMKFLVSKSTTATAMTKYLTKIVYSK